MRRQAENLFGLFVVFVIVPVCVVAVLACLPYLLLRSAVRPRAALAPHPAPRARF